MLDDEAQELIEKKIDGTLTEQEAIIFEHRLQDPTFAEQYQLQTAMVAALREDYKQRLRQELTAHTQHRPVATPVAPTHYGRLAAVVALLLLIGVSVWLAWSRSAEQAYQAYYEPYPVQPTVRGSSQSQQEVLALYRQGRYAAAVPHLEALVARNPDDGHLHLLLGNAYWQTARIAKAIAQFEQAQQTRDAIWQQHGEWYLALSYLRAGQKTEAVSVLRTIQQRGGLYQKEADRLLKETK